ncbi:MAG: thioredoxin domain-containing protein [Gemmatimonadetes bacterium]|nr:thioredoxin domain-containing protein [Gemmatimonadota bacterium]
MAGMKGFYIGIGVVVVIGGGALLRAGWVGAVLPTDPIDLASIEAGRAFGGYALGDEDAPVQVVEFADFECPACRLLWVLTVPDVKQRLVATGRVRYVFRDFPLDSHRQTRGAHHAAACTDDQGLFWEMHDKLFATQTEWTGPGNAERRFRGYAAEVGVDLAAYDTCMTEGRHRGRIQASVEAGLSVGVSSTPSFLIGGRLFNRGLAYDEIKAIVDSLAPIASQ